MEIVLNWYTEAFECSCWQFSTLSQSRSSDYVYVIQLETSIDKYSLHNTVLLRDLYFD